MPAWFAEAVAVLAQDVFRLHAFVSATSADVSRALFVDRVTAHRQAERGDRYTPDADQGSSALREWRLRVPTAPGRGARIKLPAADHLLCFNV